MDDAFVVRLYRRALVLLPRAFREAHGEAMATMLRDEWRERGSGGRVVLLARAALDLAWTAVATRVGGGDGAQRRRGTMTWSDVGMDLRVSVRSLARARLFTLASVISLALGVGGVATVYGVADRLLLRPIVSVRDPGSLVEVGGLSISYPMVQDLDRFMGSTEGVAGHRMRTVALDPGSGVDPRPVSAGIVTGNYFQLLGVTADRGRLLVPEDNVEGAAPVAVLSHALWTELGAREDVLGTEIRANGTPFRIVGVAPPDFRGLRVGGEPAFWMTVESWPLISLGRTPDVHARGWGWIAAVARRRPGVTMATVTADARAAADRFAAEYPESAHDVEDFPVTPMRLRAALYPGSLLQPLLLALAGVVLLALLAAAANVANLLLSRATRRTRELAVRAALGADRFRLGRLLALETAVLVLLGAAAGFALAFVGLRALAAAPLGAFIGIGTAGLRPDGRLLLLGGAVFLVVMAVAGVAPAVTAARAGSLGAASDRSAGSGRQSLRLRSFLASVQVAVGVVLLAGTMLFGSSMLRALHVDLGIDPAGLGVVGLDRSLFRDDEAAAGQALARLVDAVGALPGVEAASWSTLWPLDTGLDSESFDIVGRAWEGKRPSVEVDAVGAGYFRTVGIPLVEGEGVSTPRPGQPPVAVVTEAMARRYWPGASPLGARLSIMHMEIEVVGVAADSRLHGFASDPPVLVYGVFPTLPSGDVAVVLRGPGVSTALRDVRRVAGSVDGRLVVSSVSTGPDLVRSLLAPQRMGGLVFLLFAALAVGLALTGVYGVVAFGVGARMREFGVRLTLGAEPGRVSGEVVRRNLAPVLGGVVAGAAASVALTRAAAAFLFGVSPRDALPAALAASLVLGISLVATWIPARRAGRVNPAEVLGAE